VKVFYAPYGFRLKNIWPLFVLPIMIGAILAVLFGKDEDNRPYPPLYAAFIIIFALLFSLIIIVYFYSLFKKRVVLRIGNGQISCFETSPAFNRSLPLNFLVGFTHFYE